MYWGKELYKSKTFYPRINGAGRGVAEGLNLASLIVAFAAFVKGFKFAKPIACPRAPARHQAFKVLVTLISIRPQIC